VLEIVARSEEVEQIGEQTEPGGSETEKVVNPWPVFMFSQLSLVPF
jgi:hypothetical protein